MAARDDARGALLDLASGYWRSQAIYVAVHRADYSVHFRRLEPEAFRLLSLLRDGASLMSAIEDAFENSAMPEEQQAQNVELWFRTWQSLGWFSSTPTTARNAVDGDPGFSTTANASAALAGDPGCARQDELGASEGKA